MVLVGSCFVLHVTSPSSYFENGMKGKTSWESWKKVDFDSNAIDELLFASWAKALEAPMKHGETCRRFMLLGIWVFKMPLYIYIDSLSNA